MVYIHLYTIIEGTSKRAFLVLLTRRRGRCLCFFAPPKGEFNK
jgi:hypothetical protein